MGILDDFISAIKGQKKQSSMQQRQADVEKIRRENEAKIAAAREKDAAEARKSQSVMEQARRENEAKIAAAREREAAGKGRPSEYGMVGDVFDRMKEQRKQFEEASKGGKPEAKHAEVPIAPGGPTKTIQEQRTPDTVNIHGHTFSKVPGAPAHVWVDDSAKAIYIDDVDAYRREGGKVEQKDITAAMDPHMYSIYTNKGGPVGQARYYKAGGTIISLVPDPFKNYR